MNNGYLLYDEENNYQWCHHILLSDEYKSEQQEWLPHILEMIEQCLSCISYLS